MNDINILLTSAGRRSYIIDYFRGCSGIGLVHASNSEYTIALQRADKFFISPLIYSESYIPSIINYCKKNNISAVLSLFDIDLLVLSSNQELFNKSGIQLILAPVEFVKICNDKWRTYQFAHSNNILTPKTYLSVADVKKAISNGEISYPILIKPRWGMASIGIYKVYNDVELEVFSGRCKQEIFDSYLKYESSLTKLEPIIYQEIIIGEEYGLDIINDLKENYIGTFAKRKITLRSGETDLGCTVDPNSFEHIAKIISRKSKHHGILSVDCIKNGEGTFLIEMNCRISGHYPLSHLAGLNYPQLLIDWLHDCPTNPELLKFETGLYIVKDLKPTILYKNEKPY